MRRHYDNYFRGFPNIKPYRQKLVTVEEISAVLEVLYDIKSAYSGLNTQEMLTEPTYS
jgi:hypothetical protein